VSEEHGHDHDHSEHAHGEPSNAQEAFQFLALGAGIVLVIRLIVAAFGLWSSDASGDTLAEACAPFRNGYPLIGKHTLVVGGLPMIPRLAVAGLFVLWCGVLMATFLWVVARSFKRGTLRIAVIGGRIGLLLGAVWAVYCLLCVPAQWTEVRAKEKQLLLHSRTTFMGEIPWPFLKSSGHVELHWIERTWISSPPRSEALGIWIHAASDSHEITRPVGSQPDTTAFNAQWRKDAEHLVQMLDALPR
jgi:hypothetical protein